MKNIFLTIIILILLGGCIIPSTHRLIPTKMSEVDKIVGNQPLEYKQGFRDGFDSGCAASGNPYTQFTKDVNRYDNDNLYKQGWNDGYNDSKEDDVRVRVR